MKSQKNFIRRMLEWFEFLSGERKDEDDPLNNPNEAFGDLNEDKYKAELQLVDQYQSYVAELLRISLLGIAVFGFLYKEMVAAIGPTELLEPAAYALLWIAKLLAVLGVVAFGVAAGSALIFRFAATEGARYYIEALRFEALRLSEAKDPAQEDPAQESLKKRLAKIKVARRAKPLAVVALGLG